jgi:microcin C transport system permease protein
VFLMVLFGWTGLVGVVRAEFLRARNFEYVRAARALGVGNGTIMFRHVLPNAMVATLTLLPFIVTGTIGALPRSTSWASACRPRPRRWAR